MALQAGSGTRNQRCRRPHQRCRPPLENLGVVQVLDDDAAHRADDGAQRDVDIGAEGLAGMLGEELGEERSELCGIQSLVLASR